LTAKRLVAIRPYDQRIRTRVFAVLAELGYEREQAHVFAAATPDEVVLASLAQMRPPDGILAPYHAHRDTQGAAVDGLTIVLAARARVPALAGVPVMMPVSQVALAALQLRIGRLEPSEAQGIHVVVEGELDDPERVTARLRAAGM